MEKRLVDSPQFVVYLRCLGKTLFTPNPQTLCQGHSVFEPLYSAIAGCWEESVGGVSETDKASALRCPLFCSVPPSQLPINDSSRR